MSRILVLGGYGGFGSRISKRLSRAGHIVLVAGRSRTRAEIFCAGNSKLLPAPLHRADIVEALARYGPDLVVDASGPFQAMDLAVPRACIAARVHYLDIADSTSFVVTVGSLDAEARQAGVTIISGASSVPALSGAVVRELCAGMDRVTAVEMAISSSNRASVGPAVAEAILEQVGKPFLLCRGGRVVRRYGWQEMERIDFAVPGLGPLNGRSVALVDVPDVALLPERLPDRPAVSFRAGTELGFQNRVLWLLSWPVRWGFVASLAPLARWLTPLQRLTARLGSDRSAMVVRVFGIAGNRRVEQRWTLIAERGDGPEIPTLSVPLLAERILGGNEPAGARDAGLALSLTNYERSFAELAIVHHREEREVGDPLYRRVMGKRFDALPPAVRRMHEVLRESGASGEAEVTGATTGLGALLAWIMGFPPPGHHRLHVEFAERDGVERWVRHFGTRRFASEFIEKDGALLERFGLMRFRFDLPSDEHGLAMVMTGWWIGPFRLPLALAPRSLAREWEEEDRFRFDVPIALPLVGRIVHYRGWLEVVTPHLAPSDTLSK